MIKDGMTAYYVEDGMIHSGTVTEVHSGREGIHFSIDTIGACEGLCVFSETAVGSTVFLTKRKQKECCSAEGIVFARDTRDEETGL